MPLYVAYVLEQAADRRFMRTRSTTAAAQIAATLDSSDQRSAVAAAPAGDSSSPHMEQPQNGTAAAGSDTQPDRQQQQQGAARTLWQRLTVITRYQTATSFADAVPPHLRLPQQLTDALSEDAQQGSLLNTLTMHLLVLVVLLLVCWGAALVGSHLLWHHLSASQLEYLCPAGPRVPFLIAGQVYDW
jgi:hypothetical protein